MKTSSSTSYDIKPASTDNKSKLRGSTATSDKTKSGKLAGQHQAQQLTQSASVLIASGGQGITSQKNILSASQSTGLEYLAIYKPSAKPTSSHGMSRHTANSLETKMNTV
jgi:hypothetical protein